MGAGSHCLSSTLLSWPSATKRVTICFWGTNIRSKPPKSMEPLEPVLMTCVCQKFLHKHSSAERLVWPLPLAPSRSHVRHKRKSKHHSIPISPQTTVEWSCSLQLEFVLQQRSAQHQGVQNGRGDKSVYEGAVWKLRPWFKGNSSNIRVGAASPHGNRQPLLWSCLRQVPLVAWNRFSRDLIRYPQGYFFSNPEWKKPQLNTCLVGDRKSAWRNWLGDQISSVKNWLSPK